MKVGNANFGVIEIPSQRLDLVADGGPQILSYLISIINRLLKVAWTTLANTLMSASAVSLERNLPRRSGRAKPATTQTAGNEEQTSPTTY
jgi:hypothetical protein